MNPEVVKNFLNGYSIEVTPNAAAKIENFAQVLPANTRIYIAHIEGTPFEEMLKTAKKITDEGFIPMPHFPARIIEDKNMLESWLSQYSGEANVQEALLIAGGSKEPAGVFDSSIQIIETELFDKYSFKRLHVAGHPEGNKDIDKDNTHTIVNKALSWKNEYAKRTNAQIAIATQFCFDSEAIIRWANSLIDMNIDLPVHIGIAGPAKLQTLIRYSIECGVGASMKVLQKRAKDLTKLLLPYEPTSVISELAEYKLQNPDFNIEQVHFFPLGGTKTTANWVQKF
ncbi:MAG: 5,10-methylenetetrahydrofolate reductase [Flavobacteriales bacterium]|nr:5,10-methylenetetrahydrofolate reductase [Flavobacteriales bacterium]|tara:strand:+ start:16974 stop:17825 length:852 start_codon:yes stop_codon:yes gene_type:complete